MNNMAKSNPVSDVKCAAPGCDNLAANNIVNACDKHFNGFQKWLKSNPVLEEL